MNDPRRRLAFAAIFAAVALSTSGAAANIAASRFEPSKTGPLVLTSKTALRVTDEQLWFDCDEGKSGEGECRFEARYALDNPSAEPARVLAAFLSAGAREVAITLDGAPSTRTLTEAEAQALDEAIARGDGGAPTTTPPEAIESRPRLDDRERVGAQSPAIEIDAAPGSRHELRVRGVLPAGEAFVPHGYSWDAPLARHPALGYRRGERHFPFSYSIWPLRTWSGAPTIHVRVRHPSRWTLRADGAWTQASDGDATIETIDWKLADAPDALSLHFFEPASSILNGGVILAIGGAIGDFHGFRGRLGYEIAGPSALLWSLSVEGDLKGTAFVTPMAMLATPALFVIPSLGAGVGLPVQIAPERRVGARLQLDLQLYVLGFVTSLDVFPSSDGPTRTQATFAAQITF